MLRRFPPFLMAAVAEASGGAPTDPGEAKPDKPAAPPPPPPVRVGRDNAREALLASRLDFKLIEWQGKEFALVRPNARRHAQLFAQSRPKDSKEADGLLLLIQALIYTLHTVDGAGQPHMPVFDQVDVAALEATGSERESLLNTLGAQALNFVLEKGDFEAARKN